MFPPNNRPKRSLAPRKIQPPSARPLASTLSEKRPPQLLRKPLQRVALPADDVPETAAASEGSDSLQIQRLPIDVHQQKTLTVKEAAYRLGKSADAIYFWLRTDRLQGWQPGGRGCAILVLESSVNEALLYSFERGGAGSRGNAALAL